MQDEHFMRQWNAGHARFSEDADRGLVTLAAKAKRLPGWIGRKARLENGAGTKGEADDHRHSSRRIGRLQSGGRNAADRPD